MTAALSFFGKAARFMLLFLNSNGILTASFPERMWLLSLSRVPVCPQNEGFLPYASSCFWKRGTGKRQLPRSCGRRMSPTVRSRTFSAPRTACLPSSWSSCSATSSAWPDALPTRTSRRFSFTLWRPPSSSRSPSSTRICARSIRRHTRKTRPRNTFFAGRRRSCTPFSASIIRK